MSINAVAQYVRDQINGLDSPYLPPLVAWVQPPQVGDFGAAPEAHVWPISVHGKRWTMTRGRMTAELQPIPGSGGNRRQTFEVAVYVKVALDTQGPHSDAAFPALIDTILRKFYSIPIVVQIVDPDNAELVSAILNIGEDYNIEMSPAHALEEQGMVGADALITLPLIEDFQG
jgi:hypothetical protein